MMKQSPLFCLFIIVVFVLQPNAGMAMETDQYNLSPVPLADIGDEVSEYLEDNLRTAVSKVNAEIEKRQACLDTGSKKAAGCGSVQYETRKLAYLRSKDAIAAELYKLLGDGSIFMSYIGKWLNSHEFRVSPSRYKTGYLQSIYKTEPIDYATLSPTVRLFGTEFGIDKLDHIFQQGYKYYQIQNKARAQGLSPEEAVKKAVHWGRFTEDTYFGLLVAGVYSNGDLAANYAGMKFYEGLTEPLNLGDTRRPAILVQQKGFWVLNEDGDLRQNLLRPFLSAHLNEALNPSIYAFHVFPVVRNVVKKQSCPEWRKAFPDLTKANLEAITSSLTSWNGEDYGFAHSSRMVTIAEACFSDEPHTGQAGAQ